MLGPSAHFEMLRDFGFGASTESGFPDESAGVLRPWRGWKPLDHAAIAFGQGVSVTPVQLAAATAAIANGGRWLQPRLVRARRAAGSPWRAVRGVEARQVLSPSTAATVLSMLGADWIVLVTQPEISALVDAYAVVKCVAQIKQDARFLVVVNRVTTPGRGEMAFQRLSEVASQNVGVQLRYLGEVPDDDSVMHHRLGQLPLVVTDPEAPTSMAVRATRTWTRSGRTHAGWTRPAAATSRETCAKLSDLENGEVLEWLNRGAC